MPVSEKVVNFFDQVLTESFSEEKLRTALEFVLEEGYGVDACDAAGETALMLAAKNNKKEAVEFLLRNGANPLLRAGNEYTAVHYAAHNGHFEVMNIFAEKNSEYLKEIGPDGWTPLHFAAFRNDVDMVKLLISNGADVTAVNDDGLKVSDMTNNADVQDWLRSQETSLAVSAVLPKSTSCSAISAEKITADQRVVKSSRF